ncbi:hypothetical protein JCM11641_001508 [Rhodosporidiobolus odoratus]
MKSHTVIPLMALAAATAFAHLDPHLQPRHVGALAHPGAAHGMQLLRKRQSSIALAAIGDERTSVAGETSPAAQSSAAVMTAPSPAAAPAATSSAAASSAALSSAAPATEESSAAPADDSSSAAPVVESSSAPTSDTAAAPSSASAPATESSVASASKGDKNAFSSEADEASTITETSSVSDAEHSGSSTASSGAASASASKDSDKEDKGSSGIGKATLIPIIVVAACVAGAAAIWTIVRKTKFSPSRKFEAKLEPIDFVPGQDPHNDHAANMAHQRNQSQMSGAYGGGGYAASLARSDSGKSGMRGMAMSESQHSIPSLPYNGPQYHQAPYYGSAGYPNAQPGYPHEQAYGYADLQRAGAGSPAPSQLGRMGTMNSHSAGTGAYDYAAQARAQSRTGNRY